MMIRTKLLPILLMVSMLSPLAMTGAVASSSEVRQVIFWAPTISIVWPHDKVVNLSVWPRNQVYCDDTPQIGLFRAKNNEPAELVTTAQPMLRMVNGVSFPTLEYNNVAVDMAADPGVKYHFFTKPWPDAWVPALGSSFPFLPPDFHFGNRTSNVWVHATDPRTFFPQQVVPIGFSQRDTEHVDTLIQVVWPHDEQGNFAPVDRATSVNIAVDIFAHGTLNSIPPDYLVEGFQPVVILFVAEGNTPLKSVNDAGIPTSQAQRTTYIINGQTFPRWVFNDVPVRPDTIYNFLAIVGGVDNSPTVWTHAVDARTFLPNPEVPPPCLQ